MFSVQHREKLFDGLWLLVLGMASSAWCLTAAQQLGATFDEPIYVQRGLEHWRSGSYMGLLKLGTMPLPVDVTTLPLHLWERWRGVEFDAVNDLSKMLPWARAGTLVFWWLLLIYGGLFGRLLAGPWGGRLAVAALACEPSLLAHATLATTDVAITACLLAFVYHFRAGQEASWPRRVGWPTLWFALAILAKASGLVFGPICMLALELERILRTGGFVPTDETRGVSRLRLYVHSFLSQLRWRDLASICAGGVFLTFLYCGCDWKAEPTFVAWAETLPEGAARTGMVWLAEHLRIFSNAGVGIVRQVTHNIRGHGAYLLGHEDPRALWFYFPVLMTIKLSPTLLLAPLLLLAWRPRALWNSACLAALALALFSLACRVQIGIRFMLPLASLAIVGIAAAFVHACRSETLAWRRRLLIGSASAGMAWTLCAALTVWPQALCYVNDFWGGTAEGYQKVSEANYDWGQGLKELSRWRKKHDGPLAIWYFGTDPSLNQLGAEELPLHIMPLHSQSDVESAVQGRMLAVSTTLLYGTKGNFEALHRARVFLQTCQPVDRTSTFMIFDFTQRKP